MTLICVSSPSGCKIPKKAKQEQLLNIVLERRRSLPFQAPPSTCSFPAACPRCYHRYHHFSGCNQSTGKGKEIRRQFEHPYLLVNICYSHFSRKKKESKLVIVILKCNIVANNSDSLIKKELQHTTTAIPTRTSPNNRFQEQSNGFENVLVLRVRAKQPIST